MYRHFDNLGELPIEPADIEAKIRQTGIVDQINFYPDKHLAARVVKGHLHLYTNENGDPRRVADIYYATELSAEWQGLVCTKEMMNIFDQGEERVSDQAALATLISHQITPPGIYSPMYFSDKVALIWALLIRFPRSIRDLLIAPHREGKITYAEIADTAGLPVAYIEWLFSSGYVEWHDRLILDT